MGTKTYEMGTLADFFRSMAPQMAQCYLTVPRLKSWQAQRQERNLQSSFSR